MSQQVKTITSEALESAYRALTPSQNGFTEDLMASNTIIPVLDLTASAQGTSTPISMQQALAFGSQTAFSVANTNTDLANTTGFWRVTGSAMVISNTGSLQQAQLRMIDGTPTTKVVWQITVPSGLGVNSFFSVPFDLILFLPSLIKINALATSTATIAGSYRQIADVNGNLINPSGFTPQ